VRHSNRVDVPGPYPSLQVRRLPRASDATPGSGPREEADCARPTLRAPQSRPYTSSFRHIRYRQWPSLNQRCLPLDANYTQSHATAMLTKVDVFRGKRRQTAEVKYRLIDAEKTHHGVSLLARMLGVSRQGYYV
jgi:hypothetical protein